MSQLAIGPATSPGSHTLSFALRDDRESAAESVHVVVVRGKSSWGARDSGHIELPHDGKRLALPICYDEREAPFVPGDEVLVSLSDEGMRCACAWTRRRSGSSLVGIGVDLSDTAPFGDRPGTDRLIDCLFSPWERELARRISPNDLSYAYAVLFGAKEAAFKATAPALRVWYATHDEPLIFEVRDFGMVDVGLERGELRRGAAQAALDRMGIRRLEIAYTKVDGMALVLACARA